MFDLGTPQQKNGSKKLAITGALGIVFTFLVYGGIGYLAVDQRGGFFDDLRKKVSQSNLNSLVQSIEFYKVQHGTYPESLEDLLQSAPKDSLIVIYDRSFEGNSKSPPVIFFYQRVGDDNYYLRSVGPDGKPFTADDLMPQVDTASANRLGLLLEPQRTIP